MALGAKVACAPAGNRHVLGNCAATRGAMRGSPGARDAPETLADAPLLMLVLDCDELYEHDDSTAA
jgi:hypothetical protein